MPLSSASIASPSSLALLSNQTRSHLSFIYTPKPLIFSRTRIPDFPSSLFASRRPRDFINGRDDFVDDTRSWNRKIRPEYDEDYDGEEDEDDHEEEDRSLDLLLRFVENVFRKVSKRARKAVRSILPVSISTKLVGFSVNGVLILAFLWILKAFLEACGSIRARLDSLLVNTYILQCFYVFKIYIVLCYFEVACTLGTIVFTSILLIRGLWAGVAYVQESRNNRINELADDPRAWNGVQPAS